MQMNNNKRQDTVLSIIVPVYNVEKYLKTCINSLLEQKLDAYEIILVDDGSTDSSGGICDVVLSAILGGYLLYGKFFIMKWAGEGYDAAYYVGALVMIPAIIPLIQNIGIEIQKAKNMHKFRSIVYFIIAFANLGISVPLGKYYGAIGAAFGTTLATVVGNIILMNWYYQTKIGLNIKAFFKSMIRPTIVLIIAYMEGLLVKSFFAVDSWFDFISQGAIFICVYGVLLYRWGFNQEEKENVRRMFKRN